MDGFKSRPISSIYDARLLGVTEVAHRQMPPEVAQWGAWVKAYMARGEHLTLIERARFELPPPINIWQVMGNKTFEGSGVEKACCMIAKDCGWTFNQLLERTGLGQFSGYPALALCTLVGIRSSRDHGIFSWRRFARQIDRAKEEARGDNHGSIEEAGKQR